MLTRRRFLFAAACSTMPALAVEHLHQNVTFIGIKSQAGIVVARSL